MYMMSHAGTGRLCSDWRLGLHNEVQKTETD